MGIPTQQLETWARRPDSTRSASTYAAVRNVLDGAPALRRYRPEVYLQGSYANATNIRADSDVDVVCQLRASWRRDLDYLDAAEVSRYHAAFSTSDITWKDFRSDVLQLLREKFGYSVVTPGSKCLKVAGGSGRLPIDVLVAQEFRLYLEFPSEAGQEYIEGVTFWTADGSQVVNYPKMHRAWGETKNEKTRQMYKPLVRTVKNARRKAVEDGLLTREVAPSYFVECLMSNVPNDEFDSDLRLTYLSALIWLTEHVDDFPKMKCQNRVTKLFGTDSTQWNVRDAERLVAALLRQWQAW